MNTGQDIFHTAFVEHLIESFSLTLTAAAFARLTVPPPAPAQLTNYLQYKVPSQNS